MKRYKVNESRAHKYIQIPKELFISKSYQDLSNDAKILYGHLLDRMELSKKNKWINEEQDIYLIFTREEAMNLLGISNKTSTKIFKELKEEGLIEELRQGLNKPNLIYIGHIIYDGSMKKEMCNLYESREANKYYFKDVDLACEDKKNIHRNNTNINNTDISNTEYSSKEKETIYGSTVGEEVLEVYKRYISSSVTDIEFNKLAQFEYIYNKEILIKAIMIACENNVKRINYIETLLEDWCNKGLNDAMLVEENVNSWKNKNRRYKEIKENKIERTINNIDTDFNIYY